MHERRSVLPSHSLCPCVAQGNRPGQSEKELLKAQILDEAQIVCSTLSFSGSTLLLAMGSRFDSVIIDEAAQAVEPSTLIPLVSGCKQVRLPLMLASQKQLVCCCSSMHRHTPAQVSLDTNNFNEVVLLPQSAA